MSRGARGPRGLWLARAGRPLLRGVWGRVGLSVAVAVASLALPSAPAYDPWSWLIWGRELAAGELSTAEGPAWKPLPVLVAAPLGAVLGEAAPGAWLAVARAGAVLAVLEAFALAREVLGGRAGLVAGLAAATCLVLVGGWIEHAAVGDAEGLLTALLLIALRRALAGRLRAAVGLGIAAALIRVEVWPLVALLGAVLVRRDRRLRAPLALAGAGVLGLWFLPELLGSGELWRSAGRARVPNPGAPALAPVPALATLELAAGMAPAVALGGLAAAWVCATASARVREHRGSRSAAVVGAVGAAWVAIVAAMSEAGFSGEGRYLLPGVALVAIAGTVGPLGVAAAFGRGAAGRGLVAVPAAVAAAVAAGLLAAAPGRVRELAPSLDRLPHAAAVTADLERAVASAGGSEAVLRCGPPYTRRFGGPVLAWVLGVPKQVIDFAPRRPGVAFRSRPEPVAPVAPGPPPGGPPTWSVRTSHWELVGACAATRDDLDRTARKGVLGYPNP